MLNSQNDSVTVYLDQYTHLPLKSSFTWRDPEDKQKNVEEEVFDNYRLVQGIMTPHSITRTSTAKCRTSASSTRPPVTTCRLSDELVSRYEWTYDPMSASEKEVKVGK